MKMVMGLSPILGTNNCCHFSKTKTVVSPGENNYVYSTCTIYIADSKEHTAAENDMSDKKGAENSEFIRILHFLFYFIWNSYLSYS